MDRTPVTGLPTRRRWLAGAAALSAAAALQPLAETTVKAKAQSKDAARPAPAAPAAPAAASAARKRPATEPFGYCLNHSTIRDFNLSIVEEIDVAAEAGYHAVEPWIGKIDEYVAKGGSLKDLDKRIKDHGL